MGGGDLNTKKAWHPNNLKNQERVWKAEQAAAEEKKRIAELERERAQERDREELNALSRQNVHSSNASQENRLHWMYDKPDKQVHQEDYLLGKAIDKNFDQGDEPDQNEIPAVSHRVVDSNMVSGGGDVQVDLARKLREDPLLLVKERERAARAALLNNPIQRRKLAELLRKEKEIYDLNKKQKSKKSKLDELLVSKLSALGGEKQMNLAKLLDSDSSTSDSSSSSVERKEKKKKKKKKMKKQKSKKHKEMEREESLGKSKKKNKKSKHDDSNSEISSKKEKDKKSKYDEISAKKDKDKKSKHDNSGLEILAQREKDKKKDKRSKHDDSDSEMSSKREKSYGVFKNDSNKPSPTKRKSNIESDDEPRKKSKKKYREDDSPHRKRNERGYDQCRYGETNTDRNWQKRERDYDDRNQTKDDIRDTSRSNKSDRPDTSRSGLSQEEKAARLAAMAEAGVQREIQRGRRVAEQLAEKAAAEDTTSAPRSSHKNQARLLPDSLESRIHSNRHNIQRDKRHMNEHFARR